MDVFGGDLAPKPPPHICVYVRRYHIHGITTSLNFDLDGLRISEYSSDQQFSVYLLIILNVSKSQNLNNFIIVG